MSVAVALVVSGAHPPLYIVALQSCHKPYAFVVVGVLGGGVFVEPATHVGCGIDAGIGGFYGDDIHHTTERVDSISAG